MQYQDHISPETKFQQLPGAIVLESGAILPQVQVAYRTWGKLNPQGTNAVVICHALTGSADADDWWADLFGIGKTFDLSRDFVICSNVLGSCYGTTGATSIDPHTGQPYGANFPEITIRDMVQVQAELLQLLGVNKIKLVIGGSLGGMQVLEWAVMYPHLVEAIAPMAVSGRHSPWCIGLSEAQRQAIYTDPLWQDGNYDPQNPPKAGLATARAIAMNTYRSWQSFHHKFGREQEPNGKFAMVNYLAHQGEKFVQRFDANTYVTLTKAMDHHDLAAHRGEYSEVLSKIQQPTLIVAINTDILYPPAEQEELAKFIPNSSLEWLISDHGHDAFLIDIEALNEMVVRFCTGLIFVEQS
jgi:homoserine O-acetyltransferase